MQLLCKTYQAALCAQGHIEKAETKDRDAILEGSVLFEGTFSAFVCAQIMVSKSMLTLCIVKV